MANQFDRRRISVKGGGTLKVREIDPTPSTPFSVIGFITDTTFFDTHNMVESIDDKGDQIDMKSGGQTVRIQSTLMQTAKDEIDLMAAAEGKYFEVYYLVQLNNGNYQEFLMPVCRIRPGTELSFKAATQRTISLEIFALAPAIALGTRAPMGFVTAQWEPYKLVEGAGAIGAPTDAATVPQGAI